MVLLNIYVTYGNYVLCVYICVYRHSEISLTTATGLFSKELTVLLEECLNLIIVVLGERYVEGIGRVTKNSITQREIVHQLAINRMSHSDLDKNLAEDVSSHILVIYVLRLSVWRLKWLLSA